MGVELHITRSRDWFAEDQADAIPADEWLAYVATDPELELWEENGPYFVRWLGKSAYAEPWLDWADGNISSKWPDTALYRKMLQIASALRASVRDDDGELYSEATDWEFDPEEASARARENLARQQARPWWKRIFS